VTERRLRTAGPGDTAVPFRRTPDERFGHERRTGNLENADSTCILTVLRKVRDRAASASRRKYMNEIRLTGTREELGRAYGRILVERELNSWWRKPNEREQAFTRACEEVISEHAPGYLDELRALAEATHTDHDVALFNMIVIYLAEKTGCNVVAISGTQTKSGRTVFARNHDWEDEDIEYVTCFRTALKDGLRHIAFGFADPGRYDGLNEAGLAIGGSSIPFYTGKPQPGLRMNAVTRWVLDTCPDVTSAVEFMKQVPHMEACAYLLADRSGLVARVEVAPEEGVDVTITDDGMLATVNMFQSEAMSPHDRVPDGDDWVYVFKQRIEAWYEANRGTIDLGTAIAFASDHDAGICNHGEPNVRCGTIYSWVGELGTDELHLAHGRPCENEYRRYELRG
jgi:predicted choloylglycine hydrolase